MEMVAEKLDASVAARLERARELVAALEQGNEEAADRILDEIGEVRRSMLFQQIGRLTRQLHDAISGFMVDSRLTQLTQSEIPDARERLNYVIEITEQAANTTLNVVEEVFPMVTALAARIDSLSERWGRFLQREMPYQEFRELSRDITAFLTSLNDGLTQVRAQPNDVLVAQSYQDLTGQILRRVIEQVQEVESSLIDLIRFTTHSDNAVPSVEVARIKDKTCVEAQGPVVPGMDKSGAVSSQDDVDDLLSSLGF